MANFRCERVFVMLDEGVPGLNHLKAVQPEAFAELFLTDDLSFWLTEAGVKPLLDFCYAPYERAKWRPAGAGLRSVQAALDLFTAWQQAGANPLNWQPEVIARSLVVLEQVRDVLDAADTRDRRFYFAAKDLA